MSTRGLRSRSRRVVLAALACAVLPAGCGDDGEQPAATTTPADLPALASTPRQPGEVVLRGELSPSTHGPVALAGRYRARFVQYAPEDPRADFADQTAFVATLRPARSPRAGAIDLFRRAGRTGERHLTLDGRYLVEVSFGDFPYVIRFTPDPGR